MKIQHKYIKWALSILMLLVIGGCGDLFNEKDRSYQNDSLLEFKPLVDTFPENAGTIEVLVQLIGPQRASDLSVVFSVNEDTTTAVAGVHYELSTPSPVTIAAGSSSTVIQIELNGTSLTEDEFKTLGLILDDANEVKPGENLKSYVLTIEGVDENP